MGGRVGVENLNGGGASFTVSLPSAPAASASDAGSLVPANEQDPG
jgi:hypothetical protein